MYTFSMIVHQSMLSVPITSGINLVRPEA